MKKLFALIAVLVATACVSEEATTPISEAPPVATPSRSIKDLDLGYCSKPVYCNGVGKVDCNSAADGPLYYFRKEDGVIISTCGGACMVFSNDPDHPCRTKCPPPEWKCTGAERLQISR